ncbi:serine/threonine protein kinase [Roseateles oligotrophus]|uniref:Protein kinase n=1 Tax=Roseateles oligotrophus TaxID=1769250 RepID=A0ABT2YD78_9BURK|nr:serine/threonine-protein kinase [Roseateles oligotrophus]MCV2367992.1 protein kinase [Roseateles oligotrophus]
MNETTRRHIDKSRWPRLSPLLDELLDLPPEQRPARLLALEAQDAELAADLHELLWRQQAMNAANYLATPALQTMAQADKPNNLAGQQLGAYTLEREIGQGGMGTVWLARRTDGRFDGLVAIKFLNAGLLGQGNAGRFAREGQILAKLAHPHIARLLDAGISDSGAQQPYLVLEYVDGLPLDQYCNSKALTARERVALFQDVLAAVAHAHTRLILHRDLKPSNILVTSTGEVKLLDFGIAKLLHEEGNGSSDAAASTELTQQAGRAYTARYAAPEQVQGGEVSTATDVYALGVLLYLLLCGQHPTTPGEDEARTTPLERMRGLVEVAPKKLSEQVAEKPRARELRGDLDTIVAKALKKLPAKRYANAAELAEDLRRWLNHEPITARPDSTAYILRKFVRRHRVAVAAGSLGLLTLSASVGMALVKGQEAQAQRVQAEGLIEFMLGDLRKKLEPVGRLDVLDAVGEKALGYYAAQQTGRLDAGALGQRARALHLMGQIAQQRGKLDEASRMYDAAAGSTAELLQRAPKDGQRIYDHAQSVFWVGEAAWRQGQVVEAGKQFKRYLELAEQLWPLAAGKPDWLAERANARVNLGILQFDSGEVQAALLNFQKALPEYEELAPAQPDMRVEQINTLGWISRVLQYQGRYPLALAADQDRLAVLARIPNREQDHLLLNLEANAHHDSSRSQFFMGNTAAALQAAEKAVAQFENLTSTDQSNLDWLEKLSSLRLGLAEIRLARGEQDLTPLLSSLKSDIGRLLAADVKQMRWQGNLRGRLLWLRAKVERSEAQSQALAVEMTGYLSDMQARIQAGTRFNNELRLILAQLELTLGELLTNSDAAKAGMHWKAVAERLRANVTSSDAPAMTVAALAHLHLNAIEEARALAEKLEASSYRHPDYIQLRTQLQAATLSATHHSTGKP